MAIIRLDSNNNNSEWIQMLFDKMKNIKLLSTGRHNFGKDLDSIDVELSNPNTFVQSLFW